MCCTKTYVEALQTSTCLLAYVYGYMDVIYMLLISKKVHLRMS